MEDYTKDKSFWVRLKAFVENVRVNDQAGYEEKEMILSQCEIKIQNNDNNCGLKSKNIMRSSSKKLKAQSLPEGLKLHPTKEGVYTMYIESMDEWMKAWKKNS